MAEQEKRPIKLRVMRPGQNDEIVEAECTARPSYKDICALVEPLLGATLEHVSVLASFDGSDGVQPSDMFVDEVGANKGLPLNESATAIYRRASVERGEHAESLPAVYGPAVLTSRRVWF